MRLKKEGLWTWIINDSSNVPKTEIAGKYLFFSNENRELFKLSKKILKEFRLPLARLADEKGRSVLFVYDNHSRFLESMENFLKKTGSAGTVQFRNWSEEINKDKIDMI